MLEQRLLQVFDEIYKSGSVSRAAGCLGIGQPAVSVALSKLRDHFGDPLFVRIGNVMEPTPLASELEQSVRHALHALERVYAHRTAFDPATSDRRFSICMADISQPVLLPRLLAHLSQAAPRIAIDVLPQLGQTAQQLECGEADLAFGFLPQLEAGFYQQTLFRQRYLCMVNSDHPRIRDTLTLEQFEAERHAVVSLPTGAPQLLEREIARRQIRQQVALRVPSYLGLAYVTEHTDMLVTIPERLVHILDGGKGFRIFPVPFEVPEFSVKQHWHERYHHDPGNCWLRQTIFDVMSHH